MVRHLKQLIELRKKNQLIQALGLSQNRFHPLVMIVGEPKIGENVYIGLFSEINANNSHVEIGANCDIASFVTINCADSHLKTINLADQIVRKPIMIEESVFIGSHSVIKGGARIGHHTVVGAGTIVEGVVIPPYSLVVGNPAVIKNRYYEVRSRKIF